MKTVRVWEEEIVIPTYEASAPDKNPLFFEKRVYQGSSGKVYPLPVTEKIADDKVDKTYKAVYLENEYLKVMLLPELGGRIQRATDKTNNYDFVYYNHVIKPALVGLAGPWISGGIEFNWPQHHRPSTFMPVEYTIVTNEDGSKTVWTSEIDQMYGSKGSAGFALYPDKAYIEITGKVYNRTDIPQTFLWWANPAVPVNDHTISIFPPDVHAVMDHGKRAVSSFPIATGTYYKFDYSEGVDISMYKNIQVPTSYMAHHSDYDFIGNYDEQKQAGLLHIADHHVSPGKKQWTWGNGDFGRAWDRNLTDDDGPYIELMTGVFTDNQPDFTWLKPYEEKTFQQYFMPYKGVGRVKNATVDASVNLESDGKATTLTIYASAIFIGAQITLTAGQKTIFADSVDLSPDLFYHKVLDVAGDDLTVRVCDANGQLLVNYALKEEELQPLPEPAEALVSPTDMKTTEELFLAALHIEQYRHATLDAEQYYLEGLRRDAKDIRLNNGYGMFLYRRGLFAQARDYFQNAVDTLTWKSPNPYYGEPLFNLGLAYVKLGDEEKAYDAFYKATWNDDTQAAAFYQLACIASRRADWDGALAFVQRAIVKNQHHLKARVLEVYISRRLNLAVAPLVAANLAIDALDLGSLFEAAKLDATAKPAWKSAMRDSLNNYLELALDYASFGDRQSALEILQECPVASPLKYYYLAYMAPKHADQLAWIEEAEKASPDYCFPNKLDEILILQRVIALCPEASFAKYYLGNLYYDKRQYVDAVALWESSAKLNPDFPTVHRNLAFAYYNKQHDAMKALQSIEKACSLDPNDGRLLLERDQLTASQSTSVADRLAALQDNMVTTETRDDLFITYISLLNTRGDYETALDLLLNRKFHPWEGGEGKVSGQYLYALIELAKQKIDSAPQDAVALLERTFAYPENLGEGKLANVRDTISYYYLAQAYAKLGQEEQAASSFLQATQGNFEPESVLYYNDQPADTILYQGWAHAALGNAAAAKSCFHKLVSYGEKHLFDTVAYDYFAVSMPNTVVFDDDIQLNNTIYCQYLMALGNIGLGNTEKARELLEGILVIRPDHQGAIRHLSFC